MFACVGTGLLLMGINCIRVSEENEKTKRRILHGGILLLFLSGASLTFICVFYAAIIRKEYGWYSSIPDHMVSSDYIKYEYGGCVYAAFILSLLSYILVFMWVQVLILRLLGYAAVLPESYSNNFS